ncbi:flavin reductase [Luedemannella flava]
MEASTFDRFTGQLDYPMFVLTVPGSGCLIGFATQCSIDPPRFLACLSKANHTYRAAARALAVAVHRLGPADHDLAELFGTETGDEVDKLARCAWRPGPHGVPCWTAAPRGWSARSTRASTWATTRACCCAPSRSGPAPTHRRSCSPRSATSTPVTGPSRGGRTSLSTRPEDSTTTGRAR